METGFQGSWVRLSGQCMAPFMFLAVRRPAPSRGDAHRRGTQRLVLLLACEFWSDRQLRKEQCQLTTHRADRAARPAGAAAAHTVEIVPRHPAARMQNRRRRRHSSKKSSGFLVENLNPPLGSRRKHHPNLPPEAGKSRRVANARPGCASRSSWKSLPPVSMSETCRLTRRRAT